MLCAVNIQREQEIIVAAITIALLIFTRFQCPRTYVQSKPSVNFALRQGLQTFWSNDHMTYCATVWGLGIARNVILSGYVTFYRINKCFAQSNQQMLRTTKFIRNPFLCDVVDIFDEGQEEFLELKFNSTANDHFKEVVLGRLPSCLPSYLSSGSSDSNYVWIHVSLRSCIFSPGCYKNQVQEQAGSWRRLAVCAFWY